MAQQRNMVDHRAEAASLAHAANEQFGESHVTEAVGEGLAAVAHALLGSLPSRACPKVWLGVHSSPDDTGVTWVSGERIVGARVRGSSEPDTWVLEVCVPELAADGPWLTVAVGRGEWFALNAATDLLDELESTRRGEEQVSSVFLQVLGVPDGRERLEIDRNY